MTGSENESERLVEEVREKTKELARLLDDFGDRLRRMRQRNKQVEEDITAFENDLERLRDWLEQQST